MMNMLMYNALLLIKNVHEVSFENKKNRILFTIKCENHKRLSVFNDVVQLMNVYSLSPKIHNSYKSSIGVIETDLYEFIIKPIHNNHSKNELKIVELFDELKPYSIIFKSDLTSKKYNRVERVIKRYVSNTRYNQKVNKEDVCIITDKGKHSISIKMSGGSTFWESADSILNSYTETIIRDLCKKFNIDNFDGRRLKKDIIIDNHNYNLINCVYGNDINENDGCVVVTDFNDYIFDEVTKTLMIFCERIFTGNEVLYDKIYSPVAIISKCKDRNKKSFIKHLYPKVCTIQRAKNAVNINDIKYRSDIYDDDKIF